MHVRWHVRLTRLRLTVISWFRPLRLSDIFTRGNRRRLERQMRQMRLLLDKETLALDSQSGRMAAAVCLFGLEGEALIREVDLRNDQRAGA